MILLAMQEEGAGGKMWSSGQTAAESHQQGNIKVAAKPKIVVHGTKHSSSSKPLTLSSLTSGTSKKDETDKSRRPQPKVSSV